jgi:hypothetical protein
VPGGGSYRTFLVSGLFATIATNIVPSMVAMARDSTRGVVDRYRSLPISRAAVPFGQAAANSVYGPAAPANGAWPLEHPVIASLAWTAVLLAVFVPLCTRRYARSPF